MANKKISELTAASSMTGDEYFVVSVSGDNKKIPADIMVIPVASGSSGAPNYCVNANFNSIEAASDTNLIIGPGTASSPNKIGAASSPTGTEGTNQAAWADDSGYVADSVFATSIISGYDSINNQIGGVIGGAGHNFLQYNVNGHSAITGGSYHWISGYRSTIAGGSDCRITGTDTGWGFIGCGVRNRITSGATYDAIIDGADNTIDATEGRNTIINGTDHSITSGAKGSTILNGQNNEISHSTCAVMGWNGKSIAQNALVISGGKLVSDGDTQAVTVIFQIRTTDDSSTNMYVSSSGGFLELDDTKTTILTGKIHLHCIREDTEAISSFELDFTVFWDGTTRRIYDAAGDATERDLTTIVNNAGITTQPKLSASAGAFRPVVVGVASTNIKWTARIDAAMTVVD